MTRIVGITEEQTHKVAEEHELEQLTSGGWRLVQVIQTTVPVSYVTQPFRAGTQETGWTSTPEQRAEQPALVTKYVLARSRDTEMEMLRNRAAELSADLASATKTAGELEKRINELQKLVDEKERVHKDDAVRLEAARAARERAAEETRLVRTHLAKLTKALGLLQMQRISGDGYTEAG